MGHLVYTTICSVDGFVNDAGGGFDWAAPDAEVHAFVNAHEKAAGTYLYGRRTYETMRVWQDWPSGPDAGPEAVEYAEIWRAADKVVFSTTLADATTPRTELHRTFDPDVVTGLKAGTDLPLSIGGPTIAAAALRAGLVDQIRLYLVPAVIGSGTRALPDDVRLDLTLREERRFTNGTVFVCYDL